MYKNRILKGLPPRETRLVVPQLRPVLLSKDMVLYEAGDRVKRVYFPEDALISYFSVTANGESIEAGVVGNEGLVGLSAFISEPTVFRTAVQIPGRAYEIGCDTLKKAFDRCEEVHEIVLRYANALLVHIAQTAVCNKFHSTRERVSRWLLMARDRMSKNEIPMTQDGIAHILGSRRASISCVAGALQRKGLIRYNRGLITILDRKSLELEACECYQAVVSAL